MAILQAVGGGSGGGSTSDEEDEQNNNQNNTNDGGSGGGGGGGGGLFSGVSSAVDQTTDAAGDAYDAAAGVGDELAGSTDEAVGRTFDDEEGGGVVDGSMDAFDTGYQTLAGAADHAAGNTDEAVARSTDDEEGGGVIDGFKSAYRGAAGAADEWAGDADEKASLDNMDNSDDQPDDNMVEQAETVLDHALGSTDEAVARTFDDEEGGGVVDGTVETADAATGATEWANSESGMELKRRMQNADGPLGKTDVAVRAGMDFLLDNPRASVQDTVRTGVEKATGSDDLAEDAQSLATDYREATTDALEGTPADNPVTDGAVWLADAVVADPAKAAITATTGADIDQGTNEGTVGAVDAFDVGVTIGTAGAGKAGFSAAKAAVKGSDEGASLVDNVLSLTGRSADEGAGVADEPVSLTDEGAGAADEGATYSTDSSGRLLKDGQRVGSGGLADDAAQTSENLISRMKQARNRLLRSSDEGASATDEATRVTDDAGSTTDDAARVSDEGANTSDDAARAVDDAGSTTDEIANLSDEAAQATEESSGTISRVLASRSGKVATAGVGALGAGALAEQLGMFDRLRVTDPQTGEEYQLIREKDLKPTEKAPEGATMWRVEAVTTDQNGNITDRTEQGYTVILGIQGRNVYILGQNGNRKRAQASPETFKQAVQRAGGAA